MNTLTKAINVFFIIFFGGFAIFDLYNGNTGWFIFNLMFFAINTTMFIYLSQNND